VGVFSAASGVPDDVASTPSAEASVVSGCGFAGRRFAAVPEPPGFAVDAGLLILPLDCAGFAPGRVVGFLPRAGSRASSTAQPYQPATES
jgi:hypothetical protein